MWLVIGLFVVGVVLILSEFFIPGGVLGLLGGILVITSIGVGWCRFPDQGVLILVGELTDDRVDRVRSAPNLSGLALSDDSVTRSRNKNHAQL